ncbi:hypothetical protein ACFXG4_30355 [Nocardia sp. NPDC059246]|uniref:hypothetical protein n=1 Tax=unclassified Nocardia TaxID=2637762 RepID=UPI0036956665
MQLLYPIGIAVVAIPLNIALAAAAPRPPLRPRAIASDRPTIGRPLPPTNSSGC